MALQGSSNQPVSVDAVEDPDSGFIGQMRELFNKNAEAISKIAKLNTAQSELSIAKLGKEMAKNNELSSIKLNEMAENNELSSVNLNEMAENNELNSVKLN